MTSYKVPANGQDSKREEFRKYLESTGVMEVLTKCFVALYEEPERPTDALEYLRKVLGCKSSSELLSNELEEANQQIEELKQELLKLKVIQNETECIYNNTPELSQTSENLNLNLK